MEENYNDRMKTKAKQKAENIQNICIQEAKCAKWFINMNGKYFDKIIKCPSYYWCDLIGWKDGIKYYLELKERTKENYTIECLSASTMMEVSKLNHMIKINKDEPTSICLYINYYYDSYGISYISFNITNRLNSNEHNELTDIVITNNPKSTMEADTYDVPKKAIYLKCQKKYNDKLVLFRELITDYN